ncbi:MAG TPA: hypothetical protein VMB20_08925 [Candidatus Acidoferrum sp.]|nr:hypothetical protein [Candidatus Acidoferrum sp.]
MDVQTVAAAGTGQGEGVPQTPQTTEVAAAQQAPATSSSSSAAAPPPHQAGESSTIASVVAKLYNVGSTSGSSATSPQLAISYKYVSELQLVVTVFTNPETGEEVAQFPPQELIGLAEFFDQIDGVTLDKKA